MSNKKRAVQWIIIGVMAIVTFIFVMPYVWMVINSLKTRVDIMRSTSFFPNPLITDNYVTVITKAPIFQWFFNSVFVTVTGTIAVLLTSTLAGFVFAKYNFKGKNILFLFILATLMVPAQVTMIPSFLVIRSVKLYDSLFALIVPGLVSGFGIFLCRQFAEDIPDSLCEAASIDGAGDFLVYSKIILPLLRPAIGALTIFMFLCKWNDYLSPLLYISEPKKMTMPLAMNYFNTQRGTDVGAIMAAAVMITLPVTILFLALQKQFIKGIAISGMK